MARLRVVAHMGPVARRGPMTLLVCTHLVGQEIAEAGTGGFIGDEGETNDAVPVLLVIGSNGRVEFKILHVDTRQKGLQPGIRPSAGDEMQRACLSLASARAP